MTLHEILSKYSTTFFYKLYADFGDYFKNGGDKIIIQGLAHKITIEPYCKTGLRITFKPF